MADLLAIIYAQPDNFPPTINCIQRVSSEFENIQLVYRKHHEIQWKFQKNVERIETPFPMPARTQQNASFFTKLKVYFAFMKTVRKILKTGKPDVVLCFDTYSLMSLDHCKKLGVKLPKIWYHSHDVLEDGSFSKFSLSSWSKTSEKNLSDIIHLFTLPSKERLTSYPNMEKASTVVMPNYPSKKVARKNIAIDPNNVCKWIYQGAISLGHGIEEIMTFIALSDLEQSLTLCGFCQENYKTDLIQLATKLDILDRIQFLGEIPYAELADITCQHHIGIAVYNKSDLMSRSVAQASNKIYEYAACGLAVLYFHSSHFEADLKEYSWTFASDLQQKSIASCVEEVNADFSDISSEASKSFSEHLNYEVVFNKKVRQPLFQLLDK